MSHKTNMMIMIIIMLIRMGIAMDAVSVLTAWGKILLCSKPNKAILFT